MINQCEVNTDIISNYFSETKEHDKQNDDQEHIIGIDLGTCNSCCCVWRNNSPEVICDEYGNRTIPSIVAFFKNTTYVGADAKKQININSKNVFYEIKRLIGKKITDVSVISDRKFLSYDMCGDEHDNVNVIGCIDGNTCKLTPEEISSFILLKLKNMASEYLKCEIKKAVISVPAYFNDAQRQATYDSAKIAGLECLRIISEPIASAIAYGLNKMSKQSEKQMNVIVYDLGGGTLDVSLMSISNGVFEVIGSSGNTHLGGVDFDNRIYEYCLSVFKLNNENFELAEVSCNALRRLHVSCENAKKTLSIANQAIIGVTNFHNGKNLIVTLTISKFIEICNDLFVLCIKPLDDILNSCEMKIEQIEEVILVGGMTRIPIIRENIHKYFHKIPNCSVNPDETVAYGASIQGYILSHKNDPFSESITLLDATSLSFGVETMGGIMDVMIPRGSVVPITEKRTYTNDTSNDTTILIKIYEGERKLTKDNFCVGEFELADLTPAPIGYHQIEITFSIDINGIVTVTAKDIKNNIMNTVRINGNKGRLTSDMIERMIVNAQKYEQTDKVNKKKKKMHHKILELCDNVTKNINFRETKISESDRCDIIKYITYLTDTLKQPYESIDITFYENEIKRLEKDYYILILKISDDAKDYKGYIGTSEQQTMGTSVFQNEQDTDKILNKIISNELGYDEDADKNEMNEIRQMRDTFVEYCQSLLEITENICVIPIPEKRELLKDCAEETLMWLHIQPKITSKNITDKMQKLEEVCNECLESSNNKINEQPTLHDELIVLCNSILNNVESDTLSIANDKIENLKSIITDILKQIETEGEMSDGYYLSKIEYINNICNELYSDFMGTYKDNAEKIEKTNS